MVTNLTPPNIPRALLNIDKKNYMVLVDRESVCFWMKKKQ
jgi:hypothetical protein